MSIRSSLSIKRLDKAEINTPITANVTRVRLVDRSPRSLTTTPAKSATPHTKKSSSKVSAAASSTKSLLKKASKKSEVVKKTPTVPKSTATATTKPKRATKSTTTKKPTTKKSFVAKVAAPKPSEQPVHDRTVLAGIKRHPLGHLLLETKLREAGFRGGISSDKRFLDSYATDESIFSVRPQVVLQPKNVTDIETAVRLIAVETKRFSSLSLTPRGAGSGLTGGSLTDSIVIDTSAHLNEIKELTHERDEVHITCEPGVMWRDMEKRLKHIGYHVPVHISSRDLCTVGGAVGNNAAGAETQSYHHVADWILSLDVVLHDGSTHTLTPLTYKQFRTVTKEKSLYTSLLTTVLSIIEQNESEIKKARPKSTNNTSGYPLWSVCPQGLAAWKRGTGTFSLIPLFAGSQGSLGIITSITLRALPRARHTTLIAVPLFSLEDAHTVISKASAYEPLAMEVFDDMTFDLALQHPDFFKKYHTGLPYYRSILSLYTTYHIRYGRKSPLLTLLITLSDETTLAHSARDIAAAISVPSGKARVVTMPHEEIMLRQVAQASYALLKLRSDGKRPAVFLEDMFIPHAHIPKFLTQAKKLFKDFNITVTLYGHAGKGHFQFYPLIDFTDKTTPTLIDKLSTQYFDLAQKHGGVLCSELNDGILRTATLSKLYSKKMLSLFTTLEQAFDPDDIFNPGKKTNPRFDIKKYLRKSN